MPQRLKSDSTSESNDLRNAGLKVTLPRLKILDILADGSARHMSAEDIYKKLLVSNEDIGLATVYRVLTKFEAAAWSHAIILKAAWRCSNSIRARITITSCVLTAARSKSSWTVASRSGKTQWRNAWALRSAIMR